MRSRNGNKNFLRPIFILILCSSLVLNASEYLISYSYIVKDTVLFNERLQVSQAMKPCEDIESDSIVLPTNGSKSLNQIIKNNSFEFTNFIHTLGIDVKHKETTINAQNSSTTILTLKTRCFKVDFNDNFARITALK